MLSKSKFVRSQFILSIVSFYLNADIGLDPEISPHKDNNSVCLVRNCGLISYSVDFSGNEP